MPVPSVGILVLLSTSFREQLVQRDSVLDRLVCAVSVVGGLQGLESLSTNHRACKRPWL
jgi:hypothetical protein